MASGKVFVLLYEDKHVTPMADGVSVYETYDLAVKEAAAMVLDDLKNGKYDDSPEVAEQLRHAIASEDWRQMLDLHEEYWNGFASGQRFFIQEVAVVKDSACCGECGSYSLDRDGDCLSCGWAYDDPSGKE